MRLNIQSILKNKLIITIGFMVIISILSYRNLAFYVRFDFSFLLLLLFLPFVLKRQTEQKSIRYGVLAIVLLLAYPFLKLSSVYFFAFVFTMFFIYESHYGKLSSIPIFLAIIASPVTVFLSKVVGFEIRLWLTKIASYILNIVDKSYKHTGNIILINDNEFHVDAECMGLKMVILSLFTAMLFISYQQQRKKGQFHFTIPFISLFLAYVLVIISNLSRIILITLFLSQPGTLSHEIIGILSFIIYVVVPLWFIIKIFPITQKKTKTSKIFGNHHKYKILSVILIFFTLFRVTDFKKKGVKNPEFLSTLQFENEFVCSTEKLNVMKLENENLLIYIKPPSKFYSADHSPIVCWKGSGYSVTKEQIVQLDGKEIYYSELKKGNDILYTTWWYDNGGKKTISQFEWRYSSLIYKENYHLINVVSHNKEKLKTKSIELLNQNLFE